MKQRRFKKRNAGDPDWVTSVPSNEEHVCNFQVDLSNGPKPESVLCGKSADVLVWWDDDPEPIPMCFDHYESCAKGRKTLDEYSRRNAKPTKIQKLETK
jgi:hypothetical protein